VISEINSISVLSWFVLSSLFCDDLVQNDLKIPDNSSAQRVAHQSLVLNQSFEQADSKQLNSLFDQYAELFWGRSATVSEKAEMMSLFQDLKPEANSTSDWSTLLVGVCTSALSSIESFAH
jgi:hypothetical protein